MSIQYNFSAKIWLYSGQAAWHFITIPRDISNDIKQISSTLPRAGFGSLKVSVKSGDTVWQTSIFSDSKSGCYLLPIKKAILKSNGLSVDDNMKIELTLLNI